MSPLRIIVLGYIVRCPLGGMAWHYLHYVLGLAELGHEVYYLEDSEDYPCCYDPTRHVTDVDPSYGLGFTAKTFERLGFGERWAFYDAHRSEWRGPCADRAIRLCKDADLLINISGANPLRDWTMKIPARVFVDTDPVFEQIRQLTDPERRCRANDHTAFLTFGHNLATGRSRIPDDGLPWQATRQPIALRAWPLQDPPKEGRFTSVMQWDSYPPREYAGRFYGMKSDSFRAFVDLPGRMGPIFELALGTASAPRDWLREHGWLLRDPLEVTRTPWSYQSYIRSSRAEFSVAKHGYVEGWSGWFSERSAAYLASGRPVVAQDTGFSEWLPVDEGLISFETLEEAAAGVEKVLADYDRHRLAAHRLAAEYFDSRIVLEQLIENAHAATTRSSLSTTDAAEGAPTR